MVEFWYQCEVCSAIYIFFLLFFGRFHDNMQFSMVWVPNWAQKATENPQAVGQWQYLRTHNAILSAVRHESYMSCNQLAHWKTEFLQRTKHLLVRTNKNATPSMPHRKRAVKCGDDTCNDSSLQWKFGPWCVNSSDPQYYKLPLTLQD